MNMEIERKFLVEGDSWRITSKGLFYRQGYLSLIKERIVRVRTVGQKGFLTIKGPARGISRLEYEYEIPLEEAEGMLEHLCERPIIEKYRHRIEYDGIIWEVDEFLGENAGLILAEVELEDEKDMPSLPEWIGREVSYDQRYFNANLVKVPYKYWGHISNAGD
ncbi:MAG TPA: CYTH domain-containing protein [Desulfobacteraceae bacterium]|nr:CYTH domain-containing protein [Desulfobacteraceae bacterium]HPQ28454.1 CYTH domain-containing protein [Desulfobacteraceae bacterium]